MKNIVTAARAAALLITLFSTASLLAGPAVKDIAKYDADSQYRIAKAYITLGNQYDRAFAWVKAAAEKGHEEAQCLLASYYLSGVVVEQNEEAALRWYQAAAAQGSTYALSSIGDIYTNKKEYSKAILWYTKATEAPIPDSYAQRQLGLFYLDGTITPSDPDKGLLLLEAAANQKNVYAQYDLGAILLSGNYTVTPDQERGIKWLIAAAEQSDPLAGDAACTLGMLYEEGKYVEQDSATAVKWFSVAAEKESAWGALNLAECYLAGRGVEKNTEKAADLFVYVTSIATAEQQSCAARAAFVLGGMYLHGNGVAKDSEKTAQWFLFAAEKGNADAQYLLGEAYEQQAKTAEEHIIAQKWYERAAMQGHVRALQRLKQLQEADTSDTDGLVKKPEIS